MGRKKGEGLVIILCMMADILYIYVYYGKVNRSISHIPVSGHSVC